MESKNCTPSVMEKLMGLDELPSQKPMSKRRRVLSEEYLQKTAAIGLLHKRSYHECCPSTVDIEMQQECKDAFEVPGIPKNNGPVVHLASRKKVNSRASKSGIKFLRQRFADVELLSVDEEVKHSEGSDVNSDSLMNILFSYQPNSLSVKHSNDMWCVQLHSLSGHVLGASNGLSNGSKKIHEETLKAPSRDKLRFLERSQNGSLSNSFWGIDASCFKLESHLELKDKRIDPPINIVVLRTNVGNTKEEENSISPCSVLDFYWTSRKNEFLRSRNGKSYNKAKEREKSAHDLEQSRHGFRASRAVAREIKQQISSIGKDVLGSSFCIGKSCKNESQVTPCSGFFDWRNKKNATPDFSASGSKEVSEATRDFMLGEMLALPDQGTLQNNLNCKPDERRTCSEFVLSQGNPDFCSPWGISIQDGQKMKYSGKFPRSGAFSSCNFGSPTYRTRNEALPARRGLSAGEATQNFSNEDKLNNIDERFRFTNSQPAFVGLENTQIRQEESDILDGNEILHEVEDKVDKENTGFLELSSCTVPHSKPGDGRIVIQDKTEISSEKHDEFDDCEIHSTIVSSVGTFNSDILADGDVEVTGPEGVGVPSGLTKKQEPEPVPCIYLQKTGPHSQLLDSSTAKESLIGSPESREFWNGNPEYLRNFGDACNPGPNLVLEPPFDEKNLSGSECFRSICADLYGLRMQLQQFQSESEDIQSGGCSMGESSDESTNRANNFLKEKANWMPEASREFSYLVDVLDEAGFQGINLVVHFDRWHAHEHLASPLVFEALEKKYGKEESWDKFDRRLLFDRINSGLMEILQPYMDITMGSKPLRKRFRASMRRDLIEEELFMLLASEANEVTNDKALGKEIRWLDVVEDLYSIAKELEELLFSELVAELGNVESL